MRALEWGALLLVGVLLVVLVSILEWWYREREKYDGLQDPRVLDPVAARVRRWVMHPLGVEPRT